MEIELAHALEVGMQVRDFTSLGYEAPTEALEARV
jgi:hypothetical protein